MTDHAGGPAAGAMEAPAAMQPGPGHSDLEAGRPELGSILEAILLVADQPIPARALAAAVERPIETVERELVRVAAALCQRRSGMELRCLAGGWRYYTHAACAPWVERFVMDGQQARLTQAALETLAVIAYRQPVSRARMSAVRGVNVDGVVRTLSARGLVVEVGHDAETGAVLYGTTNLFLERLGLQTLEQLPALGPLLPELNDLTPDSW